MIPRKARPAAAVSTTVDFSTTPLKGRYWIVILILFLALTAWWKFRQTSITDGFPDRRTISLLLHYDNKELGEAAIDAQGDFERQADVVILGTSLSRESFWYETELENEIRRHSGSSLQVLDLSSSAQSIFEGLFLLELLPPGKERTIVFSGSPTSFLKHSELETPGMLAATIPKWSGRLSTGDLSRRESRRIYDKAARNYSVLGMSYLISKWCARHLYGLKRLEKSYVYAHLTPGNKGRYFRDAQLVQHQLQKFYDNDFERNLALLKVLIERCRNLGYHFVYLEAPRMEKYETAVYGEWWNRYQQSLAELARMPGVAMVDLNPQVELLMEDFIDGRHTSQTGRDKWSRVFCRWLTGFVDGFS